MLTPKRIDALAELAGCCRHPKWETKDGPDDTKHYTCPACGEHILTDDPKDLPTVGPYVYGMTLEKLLGIIEAKGWDLIVHRTGGKYFVVLASLDKGILGNGANERFMEALSEAILKAAGRCPE